MSQSDQALIFPKAELCLAQNYQLLSATVIVDTWLCQSRQSLPLVPAAAAAEAIGLTRSGGGAEATSGLNMVGLGINMSKPLRSLLGCQVAVRNEASGTPPAATIAAIFHRSKLNPNCEATRMLAG
jgi:hypothetical protein